MGSAALVLQVMEELALRGETGISDLARYLSLPKSTTHRTLALLAEAGFVQRDDDSQKYRLTVKVLWIADAARSKMGEQETAHSYLLRLATMTRETANLAVLRDSTITYMDKVDSGELFTIDVRVGSRVPAYSTGLGKAMLAFLPNDEIERYLGSTEIVRHTPRTVADGQELMRDLSEVRTRGYAIDEGELLEDVCCVAAPILDQQGAATAAVSVSTPRSRFHKKRDMIIPLVQKTADELSTALRYAAPSLTWSGRPFSTARQATGQASGTTG